ncbi:MAG: 6-carboxytetrahydropterin synthase [Thiolinea sp.]
MYFVEKEYLFEATHNLEGREKHSHQFRVKLTFSGKKNSQQNMLINYHEINFFWEKELKPIINDRHLNEIISKNPTCEKIAEWIASYTCENFHKTLYSVSIDDGDVLVTYKPQKKT